MANTKPNTIIGLIPSAVGGSSISSWRSGGYHDQTKGYPYDDAIKRARVAMQSGQLKGILWHQGESDSHAKDVLLYKEALINLASDLRADTGISDVPFIVGGLGDFLKQKNPHSVHITKILRDTPNFIKNSGFVSAKGLIHKGDGIHFNSKSYRILGVRYAKVLQDMER